MTAHVRHAELPRGIRRVATLGSRSFAISRIAWSRDGAHIAAPNYAGEIAVWDVAARELVHTLDEHDDSVYAVDFDGSGATIVSAGKDNALIAWDVATGSIVARIARDEPCWDVKFAPSGNVVVTCAIGGTCIWRVGRQGFEAARDDKITPSVCAAFDLEGTRLATGGLHLEQINIWRPAGWQAVATLHSSGVRALAFDQDGTLASADGRGTITLWDTSAWRARHRLEGHTEGVDGLSFGCDGQLVASTSSDGSLRLWDSASGAAIAMIEGNGSDLWQPGVCFHPSRPWLARARRDVSDLDTERAGEMSADTLEILELDVELLLTRPRPESVTYASAKIVIVGESGVGKTGLGWRLARGEFKEHASTHGQQSWLLDELGTTRADGAQCEAVLWDLAGQPDYRLIHALFVDDADLALLLFDPTRDDDPLRGVEYWLRQLGVEGADEHLPNWQAILVAARADRGSPRLTDDEIEGFCALRRVRRFMTTSAVTGAGLDELVAEMRDAIDWDSRAATVTSRTFKRIKDFVLSLKEQITDERLILTPAELRKRLEQRDGASGFSDDEMLSAVGHLANHGYVARLRTSTGERRILLAPELLNNVASSIVLEARRSPKGLGSLKEQRVLSGDYGFPELSALADDDREVLLDSAVAMFLDRKICFRQTDPLTSQIYLVFPELINLKKPTTDDREPTDEGVAYTVIGGVENLYSSLVVLLGYTSTFTRTNQWRGHARYVVGDGLVCGFRLEDERDGELDFVLYFGTNVGSPIRTLFQSLFESFLIRSNLTIRRYEPVVCPNGHRLNRGAVREHVAEGNDSGFCTRCGSQVSLPAGDTPIVLTTAEAADLRDQHRAVEQRTLFEQTIFRLHTYLTQEERPAPSCFISYAHGSTQHERWVKALAEDLFKAGIPVILDQWDNARIGASIPRFVERISTADRIIAIGTPVYRTKYDNVAPKGAVAAAEGDLIGRRMLGSEQDKETVLPVLLAGSETESFPPLLQGRVYADFREADRYFPQLLDVVLTIYGISAQDPIVAELPRLARRP